MYIYIYICIYSCMYLFVDLFMRLSSICLFIYPSFIFVHVYIYIYIYMYIYICIYIYIYNVHGYTHTLLAGVGLPTQPRSGGDAAAPGCAAPGAGGGGPELTGPRTDGGLLICAWRISRAGTSTSFCAVVARIRRRRNSPQNFDKRQKILAPEAFLICAMSPTRMLLLCLHIDVCYYIIPIINLELYYIRHHIHIVILFTYNII